MRRSESLTPAALAALFWAAATEAYFAQRVVAAVLNISEAKLERDRWLGVGLPYSRFGRRILYRKSDVVAALERTRQVSNGPDEQ